jgi:outer membrane protein OmpA-like peptidoglycan-associated protein/tetratricopeptide (TPR) repeat protein
MFKIIKMKYNNIKLALFVSTVVMLYSCASYQVRQGNRFYDLLAYNQAINKYEKALGKKSFPDAQIKLAESYYKTNNMDKAFEAFTKASTLSQFNAENKLHYAQVLMQKAKYADARTWLERYLSEKPNDAAAKQLLLSCDKTGELNKYADAYTISKLNLNTGESNFSPVQYKDGIVFVSDRSEKTGLKNTYQWTGKPFLDLFFAKLEKNGSFATPEKLAGEVNGSFHEGPATFTADGNSIYFTRNNYLKKVEKSNDDVVNLKIFQASWKEGAWKDIKPFEFNSDEYSCGHPTLSKDGNTMYFVSDMPGGFGGSDIWITKKENGSWKQPINAGSGVNTTLDEMFPFVYNDSTLYFSSKGHTNLGGLDIFKSTITNAVPAMAINVQAPLNSPYDDFGLAMNADGFSGYLTSNRANSLEDNIYSFDSNNIYFTLKGICVDKQSQAPLAGVTVKLKNKDTGAEETVTTGPDGKFSFQLSRNTDYDVSGQKDNYFTNVEPVSTKGKTASEDMFVTLKIELEQMIINKPIVLENIYYDLDKWNIRGDAAASLDKLVKTLKDNPTIKIELSSHTDSRADDNYNAVLSQKRAESAVEYLVAHGIARDRMVAKGYGESMLVNKCANGVNCTEEEHQLNRRTEFKVTDDGKSTL